MTGCSSSARRAVASCHRDREVVKSRAPAGLEIHGPACDWRTTDLWGSEVVMLEREVALMSLTQSNNVLLVAIVMN